MSVLDVSDYVRVINRTGKTIKGRYDGKEYVFLNNEASDVLLVVAGHIFGFGSENKTNALHRLGWLNQSISYDEAVEKLEKIEFVDVPAPVVDISPSKRGRRPKISSPTPLAYAGADDGEGSDDPSPPDADEDDVGAL